MINVGFPFARDVKVIRMGSQGHYDSQGMYVPGKDQSFTIKGSIQPVSGREMQFLPDGMRAREVYKFYTDTKLAVVSEDKSKAADRLVIDGKKFEVVTVEDWSRHLNLTHYKCMIVRDNREDEPRMGKGE